MPKKFPKGVPENARLVRLQNVDFLKTVNALLKTHNLKIRTKYTGGGLPTWIWVECPYDVLDTPIVFGLKAQGLIPTIEKMLAENKTWDEIGNKIGWCPKTAEKHYNKLENHQK